MRPSNQRADGSPCCSWCGGTGMRYSDQCDICDGSGNEVIRYSAAPPERVVRALEEKDKRRRSRSS